MSYGGYARRIGAVVVVGVLLGAAFGPHIGFGLTPAQALKPNSFGGPAGE